MSIQDKAVCMLVYHYFPSATGGAERQCRLQAHELSRSGIKCFILTTRPDFKVPSREVDHGTEIVRIPIFQPLVDFLIAKKKLFSSDDRVSTSPDSGVEKGKDVKSGSQAGVLAKIVQWLNVFTFIFGSACFLYKNKADITVIHTHVASWNAGFAGWIGDVLNIPVVCKAAYLPPFQDFGSGIPFAKKWRKWRKKISYIALFPEMAEQLSMLGIPESKIYILPNGVEVKSSLASVKQNTTALYVGNFTQGSKHKGFDILLKAWSLVCQEDSSGRLLLAGGGDKTPWVEVAKRLDCYDRVEFLGHIKDVDSLYKKAGLFLLPSRGEGMSNALLESQAYGLPAVVSDIPGNSAIVTHKKNGFVVPVGDYQAFAASIISLIRETDLRVSMGGAARENVRENYSVTKIVEQLKVVYTRL